MWADDKSEGQSKVSSMSDWKQGSLPMRSPAKRSRSPSGPARQQPSIISMGRVAQRELYATKPEITVLRETGGAAQLPVVDSYKHLGVIRLRKAASDRSCSSAGRLRGRHFGKAGASCSAACESGPARGIAQYLGTEQIVLRCRSVAATPPRGTAADRGGSLFDL